MLAKKYVFPIKVSLFISCNQSWNCLVACFNSNKIIAHMLIKCLFPSQFCTVALEHSASAVRELAVRIILSLYQQHRAAVLSYLPPNDAATRKNFLYKTLFDGFAKIDGKLVETQARSFFPFFFTANESLSAT